MGKNRFVTAEEPLRLPLSDGDWVEVKPRLSYGEQQRLNSAVLRSVRGERGDNEVGIDYARFNILRLETWLVEWSLRDTKDKPVPVSRAAIENLDPDTAEEIDRALAEHIEAQQKKARATSDSSPPETPKLP